MPFIQVWIPAPMNLLLPVHEANPGKPSYYCEYCQGWIKGTPDRYEENPLAPLAGRKGTVKHCIRCGNEIVGMQS